MSMEQGPWGKRSTGSNQNRPHHNPWSSGGGGSGGGGNFNQDDFNRWSQQAFNQGSQWLRRFGPGKGMGLGFLILLALWLVSGFYQVGTTQLGVVLRLGEPQRVEQPGLRYRLPAPFETVLLPEVTLNRTIEIGFRSQSRRGGPEQDIGDESLMLTGDESVVQLNFEVLWQVDPASVQDFLFNVRDPELTVKAAAESVMRGIIGQTTIQAILTGSTDISQQAKEKLQETLSDYESGILITQINLRERKPPDDVREAFDDVNRASSDKDTTINEARTFARKITLEAEGTAARLKAEAEGYKQQVINRAKGQADRFTSVYQSYSASPTTSARNMYLEAMEDILGSANKIIIDDKAGLTSFLPLQDYLKRSGPGANTPAPRGDNER